LKRSRYSIKPVGKMSLLILLAFFLLFSVPAFCQPGESEGSSTELDKQKTAQNLAEYFMQAGLEDYRQGYYEKAEETFLKAAEYRQYLSADSQRRLDELLKMSRTARSERERILGIIREADKLVTEGNLVDARANLERVRYSEFMTVEERNLIAEGIKSIDAQIIDRRKEIAQIFNRSVEYYRAGRLEIAREGFKRIAGNKLLVPPEGQRPEDYIAKIDEALAKKEGTLPIERIEQIDRTGEDLSDFMRNIDVESGDQRVGVETESYIETVNQKVSIIRGHTKAVINDVNDKAMKYIDNNEFDMARTEIEKGQRIINENQFHLGKEIYKEYNDKLNALSEMIKNRQQDWEINIAEQRGIEAAEAQREFRERMAEERKATVKELLETAKMYQDQQRYEEALGQLDSLLVVDRLNDEALRMKQMLEDMISLRKQLEVQRESERERVGTLLSADETSIPYRDEITYPKVWAEILEKPHRKPEGPIGQDPANEATYEQLDKTVDLPTLYPEMTLEAAIGELRNSVYPPLKIFVNWSDLESAGIDRFSGINMDAITGVPLKAVLKLLLEAVSPFGTRVSYIVDNGVVTIATEDSLPLELIPLIYDVTDLVGQPADYIATGAGGGYGGGGYGQGGGGYGQGGGGYGGTSGGYGGGSYGGGGYGGGGIGGYGGGGMGGGGYGGGGMGGGGYGGGGMGGGGYGGGGYGGGGYGGGGMGGGYGGGQMIDTPAARQYRMNLLRQLIQQTIAPDAWQPIQQMQLGVGTGAQQAGPAGLGEEVQYEPGNGTIEFYQNKYMVVRHTLEVHRQIEELLNQMRKSLGEQVSIEAMFLVVGENFLEDIGLDLDIIYDPGEKLKDRIEIDQGSYNWAAPSATKVPGSFAASAIAAVITGGYGDVFLDDLQVNFVIRATQAHRDSKILTAPKVTVLSGETASLEVQTETVYALPPDVGATSYGGGYGGGYTGTSQISQNFSSIFTGPTMTVTPIITRDKKHVLLNITTQLQDLLGFETYSVEVPLGTDGGEVSVQEYTVDLPKTEWSSVQTRVSVPDGGTLLLGGLKITAEEETEVGVPVLSKIPVIGRAFSNRSKVKDNKILLILVKPTIILQVEKDEEAIAATEIAF